MILTERGTGNEILAPRTGAEAPVYTGLASLPPADPVVAVPEYVTLADTINNIFSAPAEAAGGSAAIDWDIILKNAQREANYNPLIVVSICIGLIRILTKK